MAESDKIPLANAVKRHGFRRTCRDAGLSGTTVTDAVKGRAMPKKETAERIAGALGLGLGEIIWPRGYGETVRVVDAPEARSEPVGLYEDSRLKADIEALVERTVEKRMAEFVTAQQAMHAAQDMGNEKVTQTSSQEG